MLENTLYRLTKAKKLTVAYFGGSITEGAGASTYANSWAGKTTAWLREQYPDCEITPIQAAIGGTGSLLGVYRCDMDVLSKNPDLIFYEYACNDSGAAYDTVANNADAIFRKIWTHNPYADIVMIYTSTQQMSDHIASGKILESRAAQSSVAFYYGGVPQIDIGEALRLRVLTEGNDWKKYTQDTVHPNDEGYEIYMETIRKNLRAVLGKAEVLDAPKAKVMKAPLYGENSRFTATMIDAFEAELGEGFRQCPDTSFVNRYPRYIEATEPGAELTFRFTGKAIGIYMMLAKDSGDITFTVDGTITGTKRLWDHYCLSFNRAGDCMLAQNLPYGEHTLTIRAAESKDERSEGHAVRIATFMVM